MSMVEHNVFRYDSKLLIKEQLRQKPKKMKFSVKPKTREDYLSIIYGHERFILS